LEKTVLIAAVILTSFLPAFGDEPPLAISIPEWFDIVHQYWRDGQITDEEFANAIVYLQRVGVMTLLNKEGAPIDDYSVSDAVGKQIALGHSDFSDCSSRWYITGYFTPQESDYTGRFITVAMDGSSYKFREDFVEEIKIEGWGRTISGDYLGWYGESFHLSENPLDAQGNALVMYAVAVDPSLIPANTRIMIPSLPSPWDSAVLIGSDTGTAITGRHIDVYTGEGKTAHDETFRITGHDNIVCLEVQ
jgi:3D (Asp-Asp-Asp) domain-containing protein